MSDHVEEKIAGATSDAAPVQQAPVQIELPQAPPIKAEPTPPPIKVEPPTPEPTPPPPTPSADDRTARLDDLEARMTEEVKAMKEAREQLEQREGRERNRERLAYLRAIGANQMLGDAHLLSLAPDIDPNAPDGRAALDKWREANASLFESRELSGVQVAEEVISNVPNSQFGTFGARIAKKLARDTFGG